MGTSRNLSADGRSRTGRPCAYFVALPRATSTALPVVCLPATATVWHHHSVDSVESGRLCQISGNVRLPVCEVRKYGHFVPYPYTCYTSAIWTHCVAPAL